MNKIVKIVGAGLFVATVFTACEDGLKSYANDNTARPTLPDADGRNIGEDGTSDKLIDPFYKGPKKWGSEHSENNAHQQTSLK